MAGAGKGRRLGGLAWLLVALLAGLPLQAQSVDDQLEGEWYLPVGGGCRLYVRELGIGSDTVVVLHGGFGADHSYLLPAFRPLLGNATSCSTTSGARSGLPVPTAPSACRRTWRIWSDCGPSFAWSE